MLTCFAVAAMRDAVRECGDAGNQIAVEDFVDARA